MKSTIGIAFAVLVTVLQLAQCQNIRDLKACLKDQNLRLDCIYEKKTSNPLTYEFSMTKDSRVPRIVASTLRMSDAPFKSRANVTSEENLLCLTVRDFAVADEGIYTCYLKITNDLSGVQTRNISVVKDKLERCAGISLLVQNTSWLLLLLLSLPLLQATDFVSL